MTTLAQQFDNVRSESRELQPREVGKTLVIVPFIAVGWIVGKVWRAVWAVAAFCWTAGVVGYRLSQKKP